MPSRREQPAHASALPALPAEAALSFLKDTKGTLAWSTRELAECLKINRREAEQVVVLLQAQGYVQPAHQKGTSRAADEWITTPAGESVSGAKAPRFTRESVEQALAALKGRIQQTNKDRQSPFRIAEAAAFGDFLRPNRARVQSADVGIRLVRYEDSPRRDSNATAAAELRSASEAQAERKFLRDLRAKSAHLNLRPYAEWMRQRTHLDLL
jgi:DNA-binding transcriptional regulator YhcF (GntR family)